ICQFPAFICKYRNKRFTFLDHFALFLVYPDPCSIISGGARDPCKLHNALVIELNDIAISRGRKVSPVLPGFDISMDNIWISALDFNDLFEFFKCFPRTQRFHSYLFSTTSRGHTPISRRIPASPVLFSIRLFGPCMVSNTFNASLTSIAGPMVLPTGDAPYVIAHSTLIPRRSPRSIKSRASFFPSSIE